MVCMRLLLMHLLKAYCVNVQTYGYGLIEFIPMNRHCLQAAFFPGFTQIVRDESDSFKYFVFLFPALRESTASMCIQNLSLSLLTTLS